MTRTTEEQVDELEIVFNVVGIEPLSGTVRGMAERCITEAEQRGYERGRAKCAEDTKRLDWLEAEGILSVDNGYLQTDIYIGPAGDNLRPTIDAAMMGELT